MGAEGSLTCANTTLFVCGHAHHVMCGVRARNVSFAAMQNALQSLNAIRNGEGVNLADLEQTPMSEVTAGLRCGICRYKFVGNDGVTIAEPYERLTQFKSVKPTTLADVSAVTAQAHKQLAWIEERVNIAEGICSGRYTPHALPDPPSDSACIVC